MDRLLQRIDAAFLSASDDEATDARIREHERALDQHTRGTERVISAMRRAIEEMGAELRACELSTNALPESRAQGVAAIMRSISETLQAKRAEIDSLALDLRDHTRWFNRLREEYNRRPEAAQALLDYMDANPIPQTMAVPW